MFDYIFDESGICDDLFKSLDDRIIDGHTAESIQFFYKIFHILKRIQSFDERAFFFAPEQECLRYFQEINVKKWSEQCFCQKFIVSRRQGRSYNGEECLYIRMIQGIAVGKSGHRHSAHS